MKIRPPWLDRTISAMSPAWGASRARAKLHEAAYQKNFARHYDAAAGGRRTKGWRSPGTSANASLTGLALLRNRSRDLVRNNVYAARAVSVIASETVGTGIVPRPRPIRATSAGKRAAAELAELWRQWAETTACDADGLTNMYGLQHLIRRTIAQDGEVLIRRRFRRSSDNLPVPLQIQILEADHIDTTKDTALPNGGRILYGVEFDSIGRRVAYWLYPTHPGETGLVGTRTTFESIRVDAAEIIHRFEPLRAGQVRGVPEGASCLLKLRDFDEYEDAQLMRQKIAAMFAGFIRDLEMPDEPTGTEADEELRLESGLVQELPPGKSIEFPQTPQVNDDGHSSRVLHGIASGYGVTFESLTQDFSNVNYSSARMARLQFWLNLDRWQYFMMIPGVCDPIWNWFLQAADLNGYETAGIAVNHTAPKRQMLDPTKEIPATIQAMRGGLKPWSQAILEDGEDPDQILAQYAEDQKKFDKAGVVFEGDGRKPANGGEPAPVEPPAKSAKSMEDPNA